MLKEFLETAPPWLRLQFLAFGGRRLFQLMTHAYMRCSISFYMLL
jgi:hypothetical protein